MVGARHAYVAGALVAGGLLLAGCGSSGGSGDSSGSAAYQPLPSVRGVRTADGGKALVVAYTAGACDKAAVGRVAETATAVTLTAALPADCRTGTVDWALKFPLPGALGHRVVHNGMGGAAVAVFSGAVLSDPHHLPAGYRQQSEIQKPDVADSWTRVWIPAKGTTGDDLEITQSAHLLPAPAGTAVPGTHTVQSLPATVTEDTATKTLTVQWETRNHRRSSRVAALQTGATPTLTLAVLIAVADTLPTRG